MKNNSRRDSRPQNPHHKKSSPSPQKSYFVAGRKQDMPAAPVSKNPKPSGMPVARVWPAVIIKPKIIFEDSHLLIVDKPAGLLTQEDKSGDPSLVDWLREYLGRPYLGVVHRLDRNTSGIMIFAKRTKAALLSLRTRRVTLLISS